MLKMKVAATETSVQMENTGNAGCAFVRAFYNSKCEKY